MIIEDLRSLVQLWIKGLHNLNPNTDTHFSGDLLLFGSFPTGANARDGDIDTIVIAPRWVQRDTHFFGSLVEVLRSNQFVEGLYTVQEALVPIIKFKYKGTFIDMVFSSVIYACPQLSNSLPSDDKS